MKAKVTKTTEFIFNKSETEKLKHALDFYINNSPYSSSGEQELQYHIRNALIEAKYGD